ncbi:MAG: flagellar basal body rod protein FlgC [Candidatus Cloacimonadota bacterium]|nr:MAG: flagellar basal body rod protein FlgC [Candidatus Cloacimonadota bacterium]
MDSSLFGALHISSSGLTVERRKMTAISENIANAGTTLTENGEPYRRKIITAAEGMSGKYFRKVFRDSELRLAETQEKHIPGKPFQYREKNELRGVHVEGVTEDKSPFKMVYDPHHPDADEKGYVAMPNINIVQEMTNLINVSRSFEANTTAFNSSKEMLKKAIKL